jgi:hypothetical protein
MSPPTKLPLVVWAAPAGLLVLALLEMPYGYYQFLRLVICLTAAFIAYSLWPSSQLWAAAFVGMALLYNPVFRVHLDRETWAPINTVSAALYVLHWLRVRRKKPGRLDP